MSVLLLVSFASIGAIYVVWFASDLASKASPNLG